MSGSERFSEGRALVPGMEGERRTLLMLTAALMALGLVMVYSAGFVVAEKHFGSSTYFLVRHAVYLFLGCTAMAAASVLDYHALTRRWKWLLAGAFVLLAAVLIPGIGARFNGARRWISFGKITLQPAEPAKVLLVAGLAGWAASRGKRIRGFRRGFLPAALLVGGSATLIAAEPDMGTAALVAAALGGMLFVAGIRLRHALPAVLLAIPPAAFLAWNKLGYFRDRWETFLAGQVDPLGKGYHITQAMIAEGSGGWFGAGLGAGHSKLFYLPEAHNDFILAIIGEELGLLGAGAVVLCFALLVWLGGRIARRAPDKLGMLLAVGITLMIGLQALMHVAVVTHSMPTKGIGLPLVSYGGSSLVAVPAALGILMNVASHGTPAPATTTAPPPATTGKPAATTAGDGDGTIAASGATGQPAAATEG